MRLVLLHVPACTHESLAETIIAAGAVPHHTEVGHWLFPANEPTIEVYWPQEPGWPQVPDATTALQAEIGSTFETLQLCVSVGSEPADVESLADAVLRKHGGQAQVELGARLWSAEHLVGKEFRLALRYPAAA